MAKRLWNTGNRVKNSPYTKHKQENISLNKVIVALGVTSPFLNLPPLDFGTGNEH
ncbi:hypothetical protein [Bacillus pacificus]|uniref:hypothetical protein n=1 Tax=Bacillus pacificus TaxID=2026187 RepID=UPI003D659620